MPVLDRLQNLVDRFQANLAFYKDTRNSYNEHSCRIEFIDPLLKLLGWDVANENGVAPQYREVIAENYSSSNRERSGLRLLLNMRNSSRLHLTFLGRCLIP